MDFYNSLEWKDYLINSLSSLLSMQKISYQTVTPSVLPERKGIYLISETIDGKENALYVGRTKNLRRRLYTNHLMGSITNARLKKYMIQDEDHSCFKDLPKAKIYIRENCYLRWLFEDDIRKRGALEAYFTAILFPKYGISEEH